MPLLRLATSRDAEADLEEIFQYTSRKWSHSQAEHYLGGIRACFRRLREFPQLGAIRSELHAELRCMTVQEHRVFYLIRKQDLYIVRVLHAHEDEGLAFSDIRNDD
jgi:toxin ParE1/3/4